MAFLLPSFIRPSGDGATKFRQKRLGVSSLDGLRGFAAVAVMNYPILYAYLPAVFYGYGLPQAAAEQCARAEDRENHNLWLHQLPLLCLLYTGTWPISVFFVISGFSLSYRTHWESYHTDGGVTNGTIAIASSMITMIAIYLGTYEPGREVSNNPHWIPVFQELHHRRFNTLGGQVLDWCCETWKMLNIFWWGGLYNKYDVHLWTIPVEFRWFIISILVFYVYTLDRWDVSLFFSGLLIADTSISLEASIDSSLSFSNFRLKVFLAARMIMLGFSLLLLSAPDFCMGDTPGFILLSRMIPHSDPAPFRFLPSLGGLLLVALLAHAPSSDPVISTALRSSIAQYFGRISYSIYIVHGPLIHTRYITGLVAAYLVIRAVDKPCLRSAKSLQRYLVIT
ncbi:hypothetical protein F4678DRAFT_473802 [Xylaria arbuscula]|nr:hypothetical protein F4678DRAFT_473802 [Xylaria arbuscula]